MPSDAWSPATYDRFAAERTAPFRDLVALVERDRPIRRLADLGCGTGALTAELVERLGAEDAVGIDTSPAMLAAAADHTSAALRFELGDLAAWTGTDVDLVVANASLQWVPDHRGVLARWSASLAEHGQLAVQVPANADHPSHVVAAELAAEEPWRSELGGSPPPDVVAANVLAPEAYAVALHDLDFERQHVRLQVYTHVLASTANVVEWVRGTTLTRFEARWPADVHARFVDAYRDRLLAVLGDRRPYVYPFKRILLWARR